MPRKWIQFDVFSPEQILAVEILQHRFNIEKMVKISEILLTYSDEGETGDLQVFLKFHLLHQFYQQCSKDENYVITFLISLFYSLHGYLSCYLMQTALEVLQEQCNTTSATNSHVVLQLEHAQSLLLQFSESLAEVSPWLGETQTIIGQLSMRTISYEAFREQQDLLQVDNTLAFLCPLLSGSTKTSFYCHHFLLSKWANLLMHRSLYVCTVIYFLTGLLFHLCPIMKYHYCQLYHEKLDNVTLFNIGIKLKSGSS